jgi:hypothetical protein
MDKSHIILRKDYLEKLKALAYWERKRIKEVINDALRLYLKGKKNKNEDGWIIQLLRRTQSRVPIHEKDILIY